MSRYLRAENGIKFEISDAMGPDQSNAGHLTLTTDDEGRVILDVTTADGQGAGLNLSYQTAIALSATLMGLIHNQ